MNSGETFGLESGHSWDRRLSVAQRCHLRACETLARIRRMGIAALQVNVAGQQVNVAGRS